MPEIDCFIVQKMRDNLDSNAKSLVSDREPQGSTATVFKNAAIPPELPSADDRSGSSQAY